jgi:hypothetical protein
MKVSVSMLQKLTDYESKDMIIDGSNYLKVKLI